MQGWGGAVGVREVRIGPMTTNGYNYSTLLLKILSKTGKKKNSI